ncbi:MAG: 2-amino-4-hydroxy-6-hydroxymethyldihydropteridine diphosphokinase [Candidatus Omnitrophica bacterium]|nr:2-amino-4-hydroxy-6-hydroxymethyldihydropteridine diphosphokinase [Candidatus Omnitrophota bacterium]
MVCRKVLAFIGIGSNIGERKENIDKAISCLAQNPKIEINRVSSFIETKPEGGPPQPDYLNAVIKIYTSLSARELLNFLLATETKLGRVRSQKNGPRVIDLDILLYAGAQICEPDLIIPHPLMFKRDFVIRPLLEIAPELKSYFEYKKILEEKKC